MITDMIGVRIWKVGFQGRRLLWGITRWSDGGTHTGWRASQRVPYSYVPALSWLSPCKTQLISDIYDKQM